MSTIQRQKPKPSDVWNDDGVEWTKAWTLVNGEVWTNGRGDVETIPNCPSVSAADLDPPNYISLLPDELIGKIYCWKAHLETSDSTCVLHYEQMREEWDNFWY